MTSEQFKSGENIKSRIFRLEEFRREAFELSHGIYNREDKCEIMDSLNHKINEMISRLEKEFSEL